MFPGPKGIELCICHRHCLSAIFMRIIAFGLRHLLREDPPSSFLGSLEPYRGYYNPYILSKIQP